MRFLTLTFLCLLHTAAPAKAETPIGLAPCLSILALLPDDLAQFDVLDCRATPFPQTRASLTLTVPANRVIDTAARLSADFGMGPLRFVCCGYEPENGQTGTIPIPAGTLPAGPSSTQPALSLSLYVAGSLPGTAPLALGETPGTLVLNLMDV